MSLSVGTLHGRIHYFSVLHLVYLKLLCVSKMLKNFSVFISYRDFHFSILPFQNFLSAKSAMAFLILTPTELIIASSDLKGQAIGKAYCQLFPGAVIDGLGRSPRHQHALRTLSLIQAFQVNEPDSFVFIQCHPDGLILFFLPCGIECPADRK